MKDPVCGMTVDPANAAGSSTYQGTTYFFCSPSCKTKFDANPAAYVGTPASPPADQAASRRLGAAEWTCPMDPEVIRDKAGSCPICGMALEPRTISLDDQENPELKDMSRRFWVSAVLTLPLVAFAMLRHLPRMHDVFGHEVLSRAVWIELALATPVVLWGGWPFFERAWASIVR